MGRDEQQEEREVLLSIFPDEFIDKTETEYGISIVLDVTDDNGEDSGPFQYPPDYPDVPPHLDLTSDPNAPKHSHLDLSEDKQHLLQSLDPVIEETMGMVMVFALVGALKESAESLIAERQSAVQSRRDMEAAKAEEEENRKFVGSLVTRESFLEWRERFRREMAEAERRREEEREAEDKKRKSGVKEEKRFTGRELWERGLVGKVEEDEEVEEQEEGTDGIEEVQKLKITN